MLAIVADAVGDPDVLQWREVEDPVPAAGEVVIDVAATAVNRADLLQRQGHYPPPPGASPILGLECSGTISAVGAGVTRRTVGEAVTALLAGGGYAQRVAVPVEQVMDVPGHTTLVDAAALPEVACTVWSNVVMTGGLRQGHWLLVHGGGGGIGTMAIQIAKAMGARIAVTAGSEEKLAECERLGAEILINYREQDFVEVLATETGGRGVDVILDNMGAKYLQRNVDALARDGRLVIIGLQGGVKAEVNLASLLGKNASIHATSLRSRPISEKGEICAQVQRHVWPWIDAGLITPIIGARMPLAEAAKAHELLADGGVVGKILLTT